MLTSSKIMFKKLSWNEINVNYLIRFSLFKIFAFWMICDVKELLRVMKIVVGWYVWWFRGTRGQELVQLVTSCSTHLLEWAFSALTSTLLQNILWTLAVILTLVVIDTCSSRKKSCKGQFTTFCPSRRSFSLERILWISLPSSSECVPWNRNVCFHHKKNIAPLDLIW